MNKGFYVMVRQLRSRVLRITVLLSLLVPTVSTSAAEIDSIIQMEAISGLKYSYSQFYVTPGARVQLYLKNADEMLHNLVITKPGKREEIVEAALLLGAKGPEVDYVPESDDVLWSIPVVPQGHTMMIEFVAPEEEGDYPYVCTFPGHGFFMYGTMTVTKEPLEPVLNVEPKAPASRTEQELLVPSVHRLFMPDAGPASIAVALPGGYSFNWDAGSVGLRYVWQGGFLKNLHEQPEAVPKSPAEIDGEVIYRESLFTVRVDDPREMPQYKFLGYTLDPDGYPTFHYMIDSLEVAESIRIEGGVLSRDFNTFGSGNLFFEFPESMESAAQISIAKRSDDLKSFNGETLQGSKYSVKIDLAVQDVDSEDSSEAGMHVQWGEESGEAK